MAILHTQFNIKLSHFFVFIFYLSLHSPSHHSNTICTNSHYIKYIRINYHFITDDFGKGNFTNTSNGIAADSPFSNGLEYAKAIVQRANQQLLENQKMWLPSGNQTPVLPIRLQYVLDSVYYHQNSSCQEASANDFSVHRQYRQNPATVINIYDIGNRPKDYPEGISSYRKRAIKLFSPRLDFVNNSDSSKAIEEHLKRVARLLNHELGHVFGLQHTWAFWFFDGCDDTPTNYNCWNLDEANPNCNTWEKISNNIMDYNPYGAYSPEQIMFIHKNLNTVNNGYVKFCRKCL